MLKITKLLAIILIAFSAYAVADSHFPSRTIQVVVGYPAGGNTDVLARTLAHEASKILGSPIIVVNKPGAAGALSVIDVGRAAPDGYMLGVTTSAALTTAPFLQDIPKNLIERTTPLVWLGRPQQAVTVRSDSPFHSFRDLIEQSKKTPGKISIGTQGTGSGPSLVLQAIRLDQGAKYIVVPYRGDTPAVTDLLGGHITAVASSEFSVEQFARAGKLRIIASMDADRLVSNPSVPTLIEQGFHYSVPTLFYLYGPRKLPRALRNRLIKVFREATHTAGYIARTKKNGLIVTNPMSRRTLERFLLKNRKETGAMVKRLGLRKY